MHPSNVRGSENTRREKGRLKTRLTQSESEREKKSNNKKRSKQNGGRKEAKPTFIKFKKKKQKTEHSIEIT